MKVVEGTIMLSVRVVLIEKEGDGISSSLVRLFCETLDVSGVTMKPAP